MAKVNLPMNSPSSGLDLDLSKYSDEELTAAIEALQSTRFHDIDRTKKTKAKHTVVKMTGKKQTPYKVFQKIVEELEEGEEKLSEADLKRLKKIYGVIDG